MPPKSMMKKAVSSDAVVRRGRPAKVTRAQLAQAASELGFADFRLSEVARRLEVTLQTLYNHVKDRDELLHLAAEVLEEQYPFPTDLAMDWVDWWRSWAYSLKRLYGRTQGLAGILMSRPLMNSPPLSQHWEAAQVVAERSGFEPDVGLWANMAVHEFVYAWAAREDEGKKQGRARRRRHVVNAAFEAQSPRFSAAVRAVSALPLDRRFDVTLEGLLAGLSTLRQRK